MMTRAKAQRKLSINSNLEIRNSKQKGKTQNTNFKTFKNAGAVLVRRFWISRIEILKLFRISIFGFRVFPQIVLDLEFLDLSDPVCLKFRASKFGF